MSNGLVYKRCGCRDPENRKPLDNACPKLRRPNGTWSSEHGSWYMQIELPKTAEGRRRQLRTGGFNNYRETNTALEHARELLQLAGQDKDRRMEISELMLAANRDGFPLPDVASIRQRLRADAPLAEKPTLADYLKEWLTGLKVDENTINGYESHVRVHLIPHLGKLRLDRIRPRHIRAMFTAIEARNAEIIAAKNSPDPDVRKTVRGIRPTGPNTRQRIRATLRKALNDALAEEIIFGTNPATLVKTPGDRALPVLWEEERVQRWKATGEIPGPVMVWTDDQLAEFLEYAAEHDPDLYALYHFTAYRGPRRGESAGLLDSEVRLRKRVATINNQIATIGHRTKQKPPKSKSGNRDLTFDDDTMAVLSAYHARKAVQRLAAGKDWPDTGLFFVRPDGHPWHPNSITARFRRLVRKSGLPPIRFHDLRHGAATIALDAGVDIKVVQEQLGHSTSTLTRDTYQSVVKRLHVEAADAVAARISGRRRRKSA
jgi:integrase